MERASGPRPAVILFMDGIGYRAVLHRMADRIAAAGFSVLLPYMFYRHGPAGNIDIAAVLKPENRPRLMELVASVTPERLRDARFAGLRSGRV